MAEEIIDNDVANNRNLIIAYLLNAASTKLPIMEREIKNNTGIKSSTFKQSFEMAKEALKKVCYCPKFECQTLEKVHLIIIKSYKFR